MAEGAIAENDTRKKQQHFTLFNTAAMTVNIKYLCGRINASLSCHRGAISNGSSLLDFYPLPV